jgi:hypothetical protein
VAPTLDEDGDGYPELVLYSAELGSSCEVHLEPGQSDCYNTSTGVLLPDDERALWCDQPWCYVDPENCDLGSNASSYGLLSTDCADDVQGSGENREAPLFF